MNKKFNILTVAFLFLVGSLAVVITSCGGKDDDPTPEPEKMVATSIALVSGDEQTAMVEQTLSEPIQVIVKDQTGKAFAGEKVNFAVTEGSVSAASATTDAAGKASVTWTLGTTAGTQTLTITGTSTLTGSPLEVTATATLAATSIELVSGGSQEAYTDSTLENAVEVIVKDQLGHAFAGEKVNFAVTEGSVSAASATTDANGKASVKWTLGTTEGTQTLTITGTSSLTGSPLEVTATALHKPEIGDFYAGGVVFYLDETGIHGLVCAVSDQSASAPWGCNGTIITGADGKAIGTGEQNTIDIEAECETDGTAADLCANLTLNSYDDWFLPSKDELSQMYLNKATINTTAIANGGVAFANDSYWSSSELYDIGAATQGFDDGGQGAGEKTNLIRVRAVRAF